MLNVSGSISLFSETAKSSTILSSCRSFCSFQTKYDSLVNFEAPSPVIFQWFRRCFRLHQALSLLSPESIKTRSDSTSICTRWSNNVFAESNFSFSCKSSELSIDHRLCMGQLIAIQTHTCRLLSWSVRSRVWFSVTLQLMLLDVFPAVFMTEDCYGTVGITLLLHSALKESFRSLTSGLIMHEFINLFFLLLEKNLCLLSNRMAWRPSHPFRLVTTLFLHPKTLMTSRRGIAV